MTAFLIALAFAIVVAAVAVIRERGFKRKMPTFDEALAIAMAEQIQHEKNLAAHGVAFWTQQRQRAVCQRIERLTGQVTTPTRANMVAQRMLGVEVVNLGPHKHRLR